MIDTIEKLTSGGVGALRDLLAGERSSERRVGEEELGSDFVIIKLSLGPPKDPGDDLRRARSVVSDRPVLLQKTNQKYHQANKRRDS